MQERGKQRVEDTMHADCSFACGWANLVTAKVAKNASQAILTPLRPSCALRIVETLCLGIQMLDLVELNG